MFAIEDLCILADDASTSPSMTQPESLQKTQVSVTDLIVISTPTPVPSESIVPVPAYDYITHIAARPTSQ